VTVAEFIRLLLGLTPVMLALVLASVFLMQTERRAVYPAVMLTIVITWAVTLLILAAAWQS
jgi:uncharacterized membrane protein YgaE (UPF0421/DUF939 family)